ncbi:hypothetical protein J2Z69_001472 [Paenibacillus shirakamiensis]|uniref:Hydrolase n=1 Tax=Paenibacillus shirakamiensis TaxID=1265935 RepID=A0ABS4JHK7_9BACL|nr:hypothetical protein [Paenibacillus shirakamiensis]MBP2000441.1 hypothetical protein [Paenibacillus shirakamiensis]
MKKTYYVSVQGRSVLEEEGAASYEWAIEATAEEAEQLKRQLNLIGETEEDGFIDFIYPWPDTPEEGVNARYSKRMKAVFQSIYDLGTLETKTQMDHSSLTEEVHTKE